MKIKSYGLAVLASILFSFALSSAAYADERDGTWQLVKRELPDGTVLTPPAVYGRSSVKSGVTQLVVFWPAPGGKNASLSSLSRWEWSESEVAATPILVIFDDGSGNGPVYAVGGDTKRSPITKQGGRYSYQHPIDPPFIVLEKKKMTATLKGAFTDYWEKLD
jgi:hypothetical protein